MATNQVEIIKRDIFNDEILTGLKLTTHLGIVRVDGQLFQFKILFFFPLFPSCSRTNHYSLLYVFNCVDTDI